MFTQKSYYVVIHSYGDMVVNQNQSLSYPNTINGKCEVV